MERERPTQRRVVRRRPSLLEELTDEVEPDDGLPARRRLIALFTLILTVAILAAAVAYVISAMLSRGATPQ